MKKSKVFHDIVRGKKITFTVDPNEIGVLRAPARARVTTFATFKDLVGYIKCLIAGGTATKCYLKGDNGVGAWGDTTAQIHTPMCALPPREMVVRFGSSRAARGKMVKVHVPRLHRTVMCECRDKGPNGVVDINPAALQELGLPIDSELNETATWEWA